MARVIISAGHTVMDPGQIHGDLTEANLTREIAPKIIPHLEMAGVEVQGVALDLPLLQRVEWINNTGYSDSTGDICVEVHVNDGGKRGIEAWFRGEGGNNSQKLAKVLVDSICTETGYASQGIHPEHEHELKSLTFLNRTNPASVLLETLYIDNPEDIALLKDPSKIEALAKSIANGILKYLGKDPEGKDLPEEQKPKFDDLKPVPRPNLPTAETGVDLFDPSNFNVGQPAPTLTPYQAPAAAAAVPPITPSRPFAPTTATIPQRSSGSNNMIGREERKQMISSCYTKALGREPTPSDLNYFVNAGITEADLLKKIIDSQEHQDIIKGWQELPATKERIASLESEEMKLRAQVAESEQMISGLRKVMDEKDKVVSELQQAVFSKHGVPIEVAAANEKAKEQTSTQTNSPGNALRIPLREKVLNFLSKRLAK